MKVLIISACTGDKAPRPEELDPLDYLTWDDFVSPDRLQKRTHELRHFRRLAAEMYTGPSHKPVKEGVEALRACHGPDIVDWYIVSAGYGLLDEAEIIVPYNVTFKKNVTTGEKLKKDELLDRYNHLQIHKDVERLILGYDLVFFLLGQDYVKALELPLNVPDTVSQIFLAPPSWKNTILNRSPNAHVVLAGAKLVDRLEGATRYNLKGFVFKKFCKTACGQAHRVFEEVMQNPQRMIEMVLACNRRR